MERRHLIYMLGAGKRPFRRACDRRTFAGVTASEEVRKLRPAQDPVDRMRPHLPDRRGSRIASTAARSSTARARRRTLHRRRRPTPDRR